MPRTSLTYKKKLEFLELYAETHNFKVHISEKGNPYIYLDDAPVSERVYSARTVTKATAHKIGEKYSYPNGNRSMILLTDNSRFLYYDNRRWTSPSKQLTPQFYYFNRKCSWLLTYPSLREFRICEQFSSLREFMRYLGLDFLTESEFRNKFTDYPDMILKDINLCTLRKKYLLYEIYPTIDNRIF